MHQLVPAFILEQVEIGQQQGCLQGAAMFVDLSGFSVMADALGQHGHHGSEVLAATMQAIFEPMIDSIYAQGGFVIGYAGDAITAFFTQSDERNAGLRSICAAQTIQQRFAQNPVHHTDLGDFPVSAKIGLAFGEAAWQILYSADRRKATYYFRGQSLADCAQAEKQAKSGQIWLSRSLYQRVADRVQAVEAAGFFRLEACAQTLPEQAVPERDTRHARHSQLFFSTELLNLTQRGEFRPVVALFVDIEIQARETAWFEAFVQLVFELQEIYGGYFLRPDFGDKGLNLLQWPLGFDQNPTRVVQNEPVHCMAKCCLIDEWTKTDPLNDPLDIDATTKSVGFCI